MQFEQIYISGLINGLSISPSFCSGATRDSTTSSQALSVAMLSDCGKVLVELGIVTMSAAQLLPSCIGPNFMKRVLEHEGPRDLNSSEACGSSWTFCRQLLRKNVAKFS